MSGGIRDVGSLAELVARKAEFLAGHGMDEDLEEMANVLGDDGDVPDDELADAFFDRVAAELSGIGTLSIHRHMTVPDARAFVTGLEAGDAVLGQHWSTAPDTWSQYCEVGDDLVLSGEIDVGQVEWFSTFQQRFGYPHEAEVVFSGPVRLATVRHVADGTSWEFGGRELEAFREDREDGSVPAFA